jgi:phage terminase large subunit-like protein
LGELTRAERNIAWCEAHIRIPEGKFVGQKLRMAEFMKDDFRAIYDNANGTRRAIISRGRKNAKTTESAMILLLHLVGPEARANSQLYSVAQSREQAAILFELAAKMIRQNVDLSEYVRIRDTAKQLACDELGTVYKALSAESSTAYGLSPVLVIHDELGQVRGPRFGMYEAMETATAAQDEPLSIIISTQAPTDADLLSLLIDDAKTGADPKTVLRMQAAPIDGDPFGEEAVRAANPAFDVFMNREEVMAMAEAARRMPSREAEFRNLVLNQRVEASSPFISRAVWESCGAELSEDWSEAEVYAGLDLSEARDLTAFVMVAHLAGRWEVKPVFWLPGAGLAEKAHADRVPYDVWARDGFLEPTPGATVDYEYVAHRLREFCGEYNMRRIAFDRWNYRHLKPWLEKAGFPADTLDPKSGRALFMEFGQGFASMSPALRGLEVEIANGRVAHGMHPVLTMCAANAVVAEDPSGNRKLNKAKSSGRIDGMVALAMAMSVAEVGADAAAPSPWEDPDFRIAS